MNSRTKGTGTRRSSPGNASASGWTSSRARSRRRRIWTHHLGKSQKSDFQSTLKVREDETYGEEAEVAEAERRVREALEKVRARKCEKKEEKDPQEDVSILLEKSVDALETYRRTKKEKSAKTYAIKNGRIEVSILETKLSNGVGGKLWKAAMLLAEQLDDEREEGEGESGGGIDVKDKTVLELGAGVGLVGLAAAKLGAKEVVLSDFEAPLLEALEESVKRNELVGKEGEEKTTKVRWLDWRADGAGEEERRRRRNRPTASSRSKKKTHTTSSSVPIASTNPITPLSSQKSSKDASLFSKLPLSPPRRRAQPRHVGPVTRELSKGKFNRERNRRREKRKAELRRRVRESRRDARII